MSKEIDKLATSTINTLNSKLGKAKTSNGSHEQARALISATISDAFKKLNDDDRRVLYKKLSLALHPDKIKTNNQLSKEVISYLETQRLLNEPFKALEPYSKKQSALGEISQSPGKWSAAVAGHIVKIFLCHRQLNQLKALSFYDTHEQEQALEKELEKEWNGLYHHVPGLKPFMAMHAQVDRYFQPLKFFLKTAVILVHIAVGITLVLSLVPSIIVVFQDN